jgi:hypothetical protein
MPDTLTPYAALVWLCVGFCVGFGWALGAWLVSRILR